MKTIQIKFILLIAFLQLSVFAKAQYATDFHLTDMDNANLKEAVQVNITNLLTEIIVLTLKSVCLIFQRSAWRWRCRIAFACYGKILLFVVPKQK